LQQFIKGEEKEIAINPNLKKIGGGMMQFKAPKSILNMNAKEREEIRAALPQKKRSSFVAPKIKRALCEEG